MILSKEGVFIGEIGPGVFVTYEEIIEIADSVGVLTSPANPEEIELYGGEEFGTVAEESGEKVEVRWIGVREPESGILELKGTSEEFGNSSSLFLVGEEDKGFKRDPYEFLFKIFPKGEGFGIKDLRDGEEGELTFKTRREARSFIRGTASLLRKFLVDPRNF